MPPAPLVAPGVGTTSSEGDLALLVVHQLTRNGQGPDRREAVQRLSHEFQNCRSWRCSGSTGSRTVVKNSGIRLCAAAGAVGGPEMVGEDNGQRSAIGDFTGKVMQRPGTALTILVSGPRTA